MAGLRERRHLETKQALFDTAFKLFRKHGFHSVTMEQVAEGAGVSRSTAYRRFATKEDIVLEIPRGFLAAWDSALGDTALKNTALKNTALKESALEEDSPADDLATAMATGCLGVATWIDDNASIVLTAYQALAAAPTLSESDTSSWIERMIGLIQQHEPSLELATAAHIAGAYMGAIDTMMHLWADGDGRSSVAESTAEVLTLLRPILPS